MAIPLQSLKPVKNGNRFIITGIKIITVITVIIIIMSKAKGN